MWETYVSPLNLSAYSEGTHTIEFYSCDKAESNETIHTLRIMLDKTLPMISDASSTVSLTVLSAPISVSFTVRIKDADSGVKAVELIVDGISQGAMSKNGNTYSKTVTLSERVCMEC